MSIDRLSALPDSTLCYILRLLETKEAAMTCLLSKRWQSLWTKLPCLYFSEDSKEIEKRRRFVARVHKTLLLCSRNKLGALMIDFVYNDCFASDVNVWIEFAAINKVRRFCLLLNSEEESHRLPQNMYSNSSLTKFFVGGCTVAPRNTIEWPSLTQLRLCQVALDESAIQKILSGCPVLHHLVLYKCRGFDRLNLNSQSVYELEIEEGEYNELDSEDEEDAVYKLEISAPYLQSLKIKQPFAARRLSVTNIESLVRANIIVNAYDWETVANLLKEFQHVKELQLGWQIIPVLSAFVLEFCRVQESKERRHLEVDAYCNEKSIYGIIGLLESSPNLETLVIRSCKFDGKTGSIGSTAGRDLDCDPLLHLKIVNIILHDDPNLAGEPMLTMAKILLERAIALEKMVIEVNEGNESSYFIKVAQKLLNYKIFTQSDRRVSLMILPPKTLIVALK